MRRMRRFSFLSFATQAALACSAASALIYEVVATEVLLFYHVESSYSVATVLGVFLAGLGVGSYLVYAFQKRIQKPIVIFAAAQVVIAVYGLFFFRHIVSYAAPLSEMHLLLSSVLVLGIPSLLFGASFPLAARLLKTHDHDTIGLVYAADIAGAVVGAFLAGFVLIPHTGYAATIGVAIGINVFAFVLLYSQSFSHWKWKTLFLFFAVATLGVLVIVPYQKEYEWKKQLQTTGSVTVASPFGDVSVHSDVLSINGKIQCVFGATDTISEIAIAETARAAVTTETPSILNVGLGCGGTAGRLAEDTSASLTIVEINPIVAEIARIRTALFERANVRLVITGGFEFLSRTEEIFDAIVIDVEEPVAAHSSSLYTVEAVKAAADHLDSRGVLTLWSYEGYTNHSSAYMDTIYFTLKESFPFVYHEPQFFIASKISLPERKVYVPTTEKQVNTLENNILNRMYLDTLIYSG